MRVTQIWSSHSLCASLYLSRICNVRTPLECIAQGHFSRVDLNQSLTTKKMKPYKRIRLMFKLACEQRRPWIQVAVESEHTARHLWAAVATPPPPRGVSDGAVHIQHATGTCAVSRSGDSKGPGCAVMRTSVRAHAPLMSCSTEQWAWLSLCVPSPSLSYCKNCCCTRTRSIVWFSPQ